MSSSRCCWRLRDGIGIIDLEDFDISSLGVDGTVSALQTNASQQKDSCQSDGFKVHLLLL